MSDDCAASGALRLVHGDITRLSADALINAANAALAGGGGVDGAIHRAGGSEIMRELEERYRGCPTGSAVITTAGRLDAKYVIHAVGPMWRGGGSGEHDLLASAYRTAFELAAQHGCARVASPSISTGIYGFPVEEAAPIALGEARDALRAPGTPIREIVFALLDRRHLEVYGEVLSRIAEA